MYAIFLYVYRGDRPHFFNVYTPVLFKFYNFEERAFGRVL